MLPSRVSIRLQGYDYSQPGAYFLTVCTFNRQMLFGSVRNGCFFPSSLGFLVQDCWHAIPKHYGNVSVDTFQAMPNHVHGVVLIRPSTHDVSLPPSAGLSSIVGSYKSSVSREAGKLGLSTGKIWAPGFHDHVIRHEGALKRIQDYVINNPIQWSLDRENPDRQGLNEFYEWIQKYTKAAEKANQSK